MSFASRLAPFDVTALDRDDATICALDRDLRVTYVNRAWQTFSNENGGSWGTGRWTLGVALLDAVPATLLAYYDELFARARTSAAPTEHSYECSSPSVFRLYRMRIFRCEAGALVVSHSLSRAVSREGGDGAAIERLYRDVNDIIIQCSHCRRVRRVDGEPRWEWVPEYVAHIPANTSHGLCPLCVAYHYSLREQSDDLTHSAPGAEPRAILVADGDLTILSLVARILRGAGYEVTEARGQSDALQALDQRAFDLLLLGPSVSATGDAATLSTIRASRPALRCVVVSGEASRENADAAQIVVRAPFTPEALLASVRSAFAPAE